MTKTNPTKEEVFGETPKVDEQIHWIDKPKIVSQIEIEGGWSGWGGNIRTIEIDRDWSLWTWDFTIDWFWFKPKYVKIKAIYSSSPTAWSEWEFSDEWVTGGFITYWQWTWEVKTTAARIIYCYQWTSSSIQAWYLKSFDSDWVTVWFTTSWSFTIKLFVTCIW